MNHFTSAVRSKAKGIGLGYLFLLIFLVVAIGAAAMKFGSDSTPSTTAQTAKLDSGTLANQVGTVRGDLTMLATATTASWVNYGYYGSGGYMTLGTANSGASAVADSTLDTNRRLPQPPRGSAGALTWRFTTPTAGGHLYMYTEADVPSATCLQFNLAARGSAAEIIETTIGDAIASETATTGVVAYATAAGWNTAVDTATNSGDGCFQAASGGLGRVVARIK